MYILDETRGTVQKRMTRVTSLTILKTTRNSLIFTFTLNGFTFTDNELRASMLVLLLILY